jgi:predicted metal-dependent hydrolase
MTDYFNSKSKKIDLINDIIVCDEKAGDRIYLGDFANPIVIRETTENDEKFQHEVDYIENDIVGVTVWRYDEHGVHDDDYYDNYDMYLEDLERIHLNQIFEQLVNYYLR